LKQRGNHNPSIEEGHTTQWPKEKGLKNKQQSTKHTHTTKDRVTRINYKPGVSSSYSTNDTQSIQFFLIENPF